MTCHGCGEPLGFWRSLFPHEGWCHACEYIFDCHPGCVDLRGRCKHGEDFETMARDAEEGEKRDGKPKQGNSTGKRF